MLDIVHNFIFWFHTMFFSIKCYQKTRVHTTNSKTNPVQISLPLLCPLCIIHAWCKQLTMVAKAFVPDWNPSYRSFSSGSIGGAGLSGPPSSFLPGFLSFLSLPAPAALASGSGETGLRGTNGILEEKKDLCVFKQCVFLKSQKLSPFLPIFLENFQFNSSLTQVYT